MFINKTKDKIFLKDLNTEFLPAFTTAVCYYDSNTLNFSILGDCSVHLVFNDGSSKRYSDEIYSQAMTTMTQARSAATAERKKLILMPPRVASLEKTPDIAPSLVLYTPLDVIYS